MVSVNINIEIDEMPRPHLDEDAITSWIEARLNDARNTFIMNMGRGGGSGRIYRRGRSLHRASAPHEFPATDSGRLANSVHAEMRGPRDGVLTTDIVYARYLTDGTIHMEERRMLRDAIIEVLENRPSSDALASAARVE